MGRGLLIRGISNGIFTCSRGEGTLSIRAHRGSPTYVGLAELESAYIRYFCDVLENKASHPGQRTFINRRI